MALRLSNETSEVVILEIVKGKTGRQLLSFKAEYCALGILVQL